MGAVHVVKGADPTLRTQALQQLLDRVVGDEDRTLVVEQLTVPAKRGDGARADGAGDDADDREGPTTSIVAAIVNAAQSPPFMTSRRVVVVHDYEQLGAAEVEPVVAVLDDLLDTTVMVFVAGGGRVAKALGDALKGAETVGPESEKTADVLAGAVAVAGLELRNDARALVHERLGDDAGRVGSLVDVLATAFGPGATLTADDVAPYLGEAGSVPPYQLTNAIEDGDVAGALAVLDRLLTVTSARQPKPMHPLQLHGMLVSRYRKLLQVDDPAVRSVADAHAALGGGKGSTFPAKKVLEASRGLGTDGLRQAIDLLAQADIGLKGAAGLPDGAVMEVLVARLAALHGRAAPRRRRAG
jgi:DNA polymerase-3 subunit delta